LLVYLVVMLATAPVGARRARLAQAGLILAGAATSVGIALLDLRMSGSYLANHSDETRSVGKAALFVVLAGGGVVVAIWRWAILRVRLKLWSKRLALTAGVLAVIGFAVLASRPLCLVSHR
jgi:hypothetical protein